MLEIAALKINDVTEALWQTCKDTGRSEQLHGDASVFIQLLIISRLAKKIF